MKREIVVRLEYGDWALLDCAYEYYRRHMKAQFKKLCSPQINRCRKAKAKDRRRKELQQLFFSQYVIASKLYKENELVRLDTEAMTRKECADRLILQGIEGGDYKTQLNKGLYLEN
jgi:hypothetical protein